MDVGLRNPEQGLQYKMEIRGEEFVLEVQADAPMLWHILIAMAGKFVRLAMF